MIASFRSSSSPSSLSSSRFLRAFVLLITLALAACGKGASDSPSSASLDRTALMQLAFPGWTTDGAKHNAKLHVPVAFSGVVDANKKPMEDIWDAQVDPAFVVRLSDDDATLIVLAQVLSDDGKVMGCHGCRVNYGAVQFHRREEKWRITSRQDIFAAGGEIDVGNFPQIIKLSQHAYALKVDMFYAQSGEARHSTELFELTANGPHDLLNPAGDGGISLSADDDGMIGDSHCSGPPPKDGKKAITDDEQNQCFHIVAKWSLDAKGETPGDMVVQYTGMKRVPDNDKDKDKVYRYHRVNERMVWKYKDGLYVLVSGKDPTDGLTF